MIHATVLLNFSDSCLVNILQVSRGQNVLPRVPEYKVNKPFFDYQFSGKYLNRRCFNHFY